MNSEWAKAACYSPYVDPTIFFGGEEGDLAAARALCRHCEMRSACLEWALDHREPYGVWGGLTVKERTAALRRRAEAAIQALVREAS